MKKFVILITIAMIFTSCYFNKDFTSKDISKYEQAKDVLIKNKSKPLVKFNTLQKSIEFVNSFMLSLINMIPELVTINVDTDLNRSYGKALFQLAFTTWLTPIAFGPPQLTATEIMDKTKLAFTDKDGNILPAYNQTVEIFTQAYELFNN